jgi:hypothetical protein
MSTEADCPWLAPDFFMFATLNFQIRFDVTLVR